MTWQRDKLLLGIFLKMVVVVQLVRTSDCGSEGRGFESPLPPLLLVRFGIRAIRFNNMIANATFRSQLDHRFTNNIS
jgi:hypothetical protein